MRLLLALVTLLLSIRPIDAWSAVGTVTSQTGPTEIVRKRQSVPSQAGTAIEMNDTVVTARSRAELTFVDKTQVRITEQSKLVIDDFVYDPRQGTGKLAMKMALGTARYASGQIAKNSPQNVAVTTPTATVAVRGTDFSMTVDELGRSLVMLLPSCDERSCVTGVIEVFNDAGRVTLTQAYQATVVNSLNQAPSQPTIVSVDPNNINNLLIVSPPPEIKQDQQSNAGNEQEFNLLNADLLKYNELEKNYLENRFLDTDFLENSFLNNELDAFGVNVWAATAYLLDNGMLPGYDPAGLLKYAVDDQDRLLLTRRVNNHYTELVVHKEANLVVDIRQDGIPVWQRVNRGGSTTITIVQRQ
jgi:hypothetical protein